MLVSQFQDVRRFLGRLDAGQDLTAGLKTVCRENGILSGWIQATAVLRNPTIAPLKADGSGMGDPVALDGVAFCPTITGNVSLLDGVLDLRLYATCHPPEAASGPATLGLLRGGEVLAFEFLLLACDDAVLVRENDARFGFAPWIQLQPGTQVGMVTPPAPAPVPNMWTGDEGRLPGAAMGTVSDIPAAAPLLRQPIDEDESSELNVLDMSVGDYLDHPRFGKCRIVHDPHDDKVTIRLETGKHVDLHLGVMRVLPPKQIGSKKVFQIEMRKRG
jgi:predicted DNA-binding protein with PD1-like motif